MADEVGSYLTSQASWFLFSPLHSIIQLLLPSSTHSILRLHFLSTAVNMRACSGRLVPTWTGYDSTSPSYMQPCDSWRMTHLHLHEGTWTRSEHNIPFTSQALNAKEGASPLINFSYALFFAFISVYPPPPLCIRDVLFLSLPHMYRKTIKKTGLDSAILMRDGGLQNSIH